MDYAGMLDAVFATMGKPVVYFERDRLPRSLVGVPMRMAMSPGGDIEDSGGLVPVRDILRLRASDFPGDQEPSQGAVVRTDGGDPKVITDVLSDPRGWYDLPLAAADQGE